MNSLLLHNPKIIINYDIPKAMSSLSQGLRTNQLITRNLVQMYQPILHCLAYLHIFRIV